ncbi:Transcription factor/CCAAT displacement protein CDP1 [Klebsormidium nitens]|uniref:Protein CASP n=1 Tax=Klebsormidium nitens TaxID=105231 RepID=A0A1Y1I9X1_KLENI|nr:Transcription factor/CCAAT displacement protein CDP1 [Klebsormidium nitens]|eukprot:GAQ87720.1 Transcription factor/CCAAT displacement protein CDP1 [Klebsormidium nitens]
MIGPEDQVPKPPEERRDGRKADAFNNASPISVVLGYWKEFDLENARGKLDEQGLRIAEHQEQSMTNRRKLAESTRDFKKADTEEKVKLFGPLLKAYQEEVDNLTKRAKFGENAFLNVYQKLYEAPDPVSCLASASETAARVAELEAENRRFRQELEEYRAEASNLKNQQVTVRRLEERNRQLEQQMEEKVREIVEMKQRSLAEENQKSLEVLKSREDHLQEQLRTARDTLSNMQKLHEYGQSQLFELRTQSEEERAVRHSELTLLTDEVERAQARLMQLEKEKEDLRGQVQASNEGGGVRTSDPYDDSHLEAALLAKEKVISELHAELHKLETALAGEKEERLAEIKKLHVALDEKVSEVESLKAELLQRPTSKQVDDLRKQVKILQAVGYNSVEAEDWEIATRGDDIGKLETLLLDKNRRLEHELTQAKVQLSERSAEAEKALQKVKELSAKIEEQRDLIVRLEEDIQKGFSAERRSSREEPWGEPAQERGVTALLQAGKSEGEDHSMLAVIAGQRDRFKQRMNQLDEELRTAKDRIRTLTVDLERIKADNVALYEKMRFVQDYQKGDVTARGNRKGAVDLEAGADVEGRYKKLYEENIDPFKEFSRKERDQRYKELGLRDKIALTSGRFLMANKFARTFVFFYSVALHLLVWFTMYRLSMQNVEHIKDCNNAAQIAFETRGQGTNLL